MRVLITGGVGFIGSHLATALVARGDSVLALDNLSTGSIKNTQHISKNFDFVQGDIRDSNLVNDLTSQVDVVFHLAAAVGVNLILEAPMQSIATNIFGSENVLLAAAKHKKRILIASTSEIYGKGIKQPLNELDDRVIGSPQKIRWSYSDAKAIDEAMAFSLNRELGLQVTTARLFNTVGPRQSSRYGMVVPRFVGAALKNLPIPVYGDGTQTRVFCHVLDVVDALLQLVEKPTTVNEVYNVGGEGEISMTALASKIIAATKSGSTIEYIPYEQAYVAGFEDMQRRVPDIAKIKKTINWSPKRDLVQIISDVATDISKS